MIVHKWSQQSTQSFIGNPISGIFQEMDIKTMNIVRNMALPYNRSCMPWVGGHNCILIAIGSLQSWCDKIGWSAWCKWLNNGF